MNDNAKAWVAALRSGKYKQAQSRLREGDNTFCCLGVACDLYRKAGGPRWKHDVDGDWAYFNDSGYLPIVVMEWLGIRTRAGDFEIDGDEDGADRLTGKNDRGDSFVEIAATIELEPTDLFTEPTQ